MMLARRLLLAAPALLAPALFAPVLVTLPALAQTPPPKDLVIINRKIGFGDIAANNRWVTVQYTGWLFDPNAKDNKGFKFDSSIGRAPFSFQLGGGRVISGWEQGIAGMKVGGQRTLIVPPELGYGGRGAGGVVPPNATMIFDVELIGVR
jgi:FKBP-type peptidyl-prolyl cis-trans isomerase FkpA